MSLAKLIGRLSLGLIGVLSGVALLLVVTAGCILYVRPVRTAVLNTGVTIANEQTDIDVDLGGIYLSLFLHSPVVLYRAYKGQSDLPLRVEIDSLFVGHRGIDTLVYVHALRLRSGDESGVGKPSGQGGRVPAAHQGYCGEYPSRQFPFRTFVRSLLCRRSEQPCVRRHHTRTDRVISRRQSGYDTAYQHLFQHAFRA